MSSVRSSAGPAVRSLLPRDVYRSARKSFDQWFYFAITSDGERIGPYRARTDDGETDAEIVDMLLDRLDAIDPVRHLALVPTTPTPAVSVGARAARSQLLGGRTSSRLRPAAPPESPSRTPARAPSAPG